MRMFAFIMVSAVVMFVLGCLPASQGRYTDGTPQLDLESGTVTDPVDSVLEWGAILAGAIPGLGVGVSALLVGVRKARTARMQKHQQALRSDSIVQNLVRNIEDIKRHVDQGPLEEIQAGIRQTLQDQTPTTQAAVAEIRRLWTQVSMQFPLKDNG